MAEIFKQKNLEPAERACAEKTKCVGLYFIADHRAAEIQATKGNQERQVKPNDEYIKITVPIARPNIEYENMEELFTRLNNQG